MAVTAAGTGLLAHFSALEDPRQSGKVLYPLPEILLVVLCGTLSGCDDFVEMALWGREHLSFLRGFEPFARGIASHDTLNDVVRALDPALFEDCFVSWINSFVVRREARRSPSRRRSRSMARPCGAAAAGGVPDRCIWSRPGRVASVWCWPRKR